MIRDSKIMRRNPVRVGQPLSTASPLWRELSSGLFMLRVRCQDFSFQFIVPSLFVPPLIQSFALITIPSARGHQGRHKLLERNSLLFFNQLSHNQEARLICL